MEPRIISHKIEQIDRHGYKTKVSPQERRHTVRLSNGETHTAITSLAPTVEEERKVLNSLLDKAEYGPVNERKVVK